MCEISEDNKCDNCDPKNFICIEFDRKNVSIFELKREKNKGKFTYQKLLYQGGNLKIVVEDCCWQIIILFL